MDHQSLSGSIDQEKVEALRREYTRDGIDADNVEKDPVDQFAVWFKDAVDANLPDANAMTLSTANAFAKPSGRIVLLKGFDKQGFRFYTNYQSRKGIELQENPMAALCFYWSHLERQVRIEGTVEKVSREKSSEYFHKRPRESQLSAWISRQSSQVKSREMLEEAYREAEKKFEDEEIPLPDYWGGYQLKPSMFEFWQGRPGRLHDRICYVRVNGDWMIKRLSP